MEANSLTSGCKAGDGFGEILLMKSVICSKIWRRTLEIMAKVSRRFRETSEGLTVGECIAKGLRQFGQKLANVHQQFCTCLAC